MEQHNTTISNNNHKNTFNTQTVTSQIQNEPIYNNNNNYNTNNSTKINEHNKTILDIDYSQKHYDPKYQNNIQEREHHIFRYNGYWTSTQIIMNCEIEFPIEDIEYTKILSKWTNAHPHTGRIRLKWIIGSKNAASVDTQYETEEEYKNRILPFMPDIILLLFGKTGLPYNMNTGSSNIPQWGKYLPSWFQGRDAQGQDVKYLPYQYLTLPYRLQSDWLCDNSIDPKKDKLIRPEERYSQGDWSSYTIEQRWQIINDTIPQIHNYIDSSEIQQLRQTHILLYPKIGKGFMMARIIISITKVFPEFYYFFYPLQVKLTLNWERSLYNKVSFHTQYYENNKIQDYHALVPSMLLRWHQLCCTNINTPIKERSIIPYDIARLRYDNYKIENNNYKNRSNNNNNNNGFYNNPNTEFNNRRPNNNNNNNNPMYNNNTQTSNNQFENTNDTFPNTQNTQKYNNNYDDQYNTSNYNGINYNSGTNSNITPQPHTMSIPNYRGRKTGYNGRNRGGRGYYGNTNNRNKNNTQNDENYASKQQIQNNANIGQPIKLSFMNVPQNDNNPRV
jgi:hypothetical protein